MAARCCPSTPRPPPTAPPTSTTCGPARTVAPTAPSPTTTERPAARRPTSTPPGATEVNFPTPRLVPRGDRVAPHRRLRRGPAGRPPQRSERRGGEATTVEPRRGALVERAVARHRHRLPRRAPPVRRPRDAAVRSSSARATTSQLTIRSGTGSPAARSCTSSPTRCRPASSCCSDRPPDAPVAGSGSCPSQGVASWWPAADPPCRRCAPGPSRPHTRSPPRRASSGA